MLSGKSSCFLLTSATYFHVVLRILKDLHWIIWHFCLFSVVSKVLIVDLMILVGLFYLRLFCDFFFYIETSSDMYEMVAQSMLKSSWISNYLCPMLEENHSFEIVNDPLVYVRCVEGVTEIFFDTYKTYKQLLHIRDLQMLGVRSRCLAWSSSHSARSFEGCVDYLEVLSLRSWL